MIGDDPLLAKSIYHMLDSSPESNFQPVLGGSLQAGLTRLASENFDALLLEVQEPGSGAAAGVAEILQQSKSLPIIALIPQGKEAAGQEALEAGAMEFLFIESLSRELLQKVLRYGIERRRSEYAVRRYEQRFHELFENAKDILFTLNLEGNITSLNKSAEEVMGWARHEVLGRNIKNFVTPENLSLCTQMMQHIVNEEPSQHFEIGMLCKDGRKALLEVSAHLLHSEGKKEGVQGIARDVTERRDLESMVRHSQKLEAIGRLSGGLAHDFNNLLCVINGHAELLSERIEPTNSAVKSVTQIKKAVDSASSLTRQLLAFSRKQVFYPQILDLNTIVAETEKLLGRLIGENIEFLTSLQPALGRVRVDPVQVEQVLMNLVLNARDAMPQGGELRIETSNENLEEIQAFKRTIVPPGKYVVLKVTDSGCGMDDETQSRIFEPFYTTKELGEGTGLGLATVYGIVKQSGGFIWVDSDPGHGTTFRIYLPRVENPLAPLLDGPLRADPRKGTETILLVENSEPLRALAKEFLKGSGYAVLEAENGKEALHIVKAFSGPIQLLLTDVIMPAMGGKQLAEQLASLRPATKVLYMSGYPDDGIAQSGTLGAEIVFLQKPFTRETLLRKVRQVLDELPQENSRAVLP
jgi:PAS domain S-box-containing protein